MTRNQIDHICISKHWKLSLHDFKSILDADIGSDHQLVQAKIKFKFNAKQKNAPVKLFNSDKLITDQKVAAHFQQAVQNSLTTKEINNSTDVNNDTWHTLKNSLLVAASQELGCCKSKKDKWTSEKTTELIKLRQQIQLNRDNIQDDTFVDRSITKEHNIINFKKSANKDKNDWIDNITKEIKKANKTGNLREVYRLTDLVINDSKSSVPVGIKHPLSGQIITDPAEVKEIWERHFMQVLNKQQLDTSIIKSPFDTLITLNIDMNLIREDEVRFAISKMKNRKTPGFDRITAEMLKSGGDKVATLLTRQCNLSWTLKEEPPDDWSRILINAIFRKDPSWRLRITEVYQERYLLMYC